MIAHYEHERTGQRASVSTAGAFFGCLFFGFLYFFYKGLIGHGLAMLLAPIVLALLFPPLALFTVFYPLFAPSIVRNSHEAKGFTRVGW